MIKTAEFVRLRALEKGIEVQEGITINDEINEFIKENNIEELIDIKYVKSMEFCNDDFYILTSALVIYKN